MYNPNIPNINEVGHYKKINVTELRQMPEDELVRFFVDMPGGEFGRQKKEMTKEEVTEFTEFFNNIPDDIFDEIMNTRRNNREIERQKIDEERENIIKECEELIKLCDKISNDCDVEINKTQHVINTITGNIIDVCSDNN